MVSFFTLVAFISAVAASSTDPHFYHRGHSLKDCPQHNMASHITYNPTKTKSYKAIQTRKPSKNYLQSYSSGYGSVQYGFDIDDMLRQVNQARAKAGASPLRVSQSLMQAALRHSQDQANSRRMTHTGSNGSDHSARYKLVGYKGRGTAENVAYNQRTVSAVMQSWIKSPGHYKNIINPKFRDFGAAMVGYYWTQNFGSGE